MQPAKRIEDRYKEIDLVAVGKTADVNETPHPLYRRIEPNKDIPCSVKFPNSSICCGEPSVFVGLDEKGRIGLCGNFAHVPPGRVFENV